ncbi:MAG: hypothetical protein KAJ97_03905, partial [Acidobacteria bacterium]|nr:hypothetical protein [Acidobacteriota bacterium]
THASLAAVYGQLGDRPAARHAVSELLAQKPDFGATAREEWGRWVGPGELLEHLIDGLRKAGLDVDTPGGDTTELKPSDEASAAEALGSVAIAVLPFSDMSPDKDQNYFCEGMAEEIMNALVHIDGIRVASRTSAFRAMEEKKDLKSVGRALSVSQILEGSVRIAGNRLRVTAQLIEVETGFQLWSERYDREAEDVFAVQDEIAAGVVQAVKSRLAPGERTVQAREQVGNLEAYRHYLKGRYLRYTKNDHAGALQSYEEAVRLDPTHGPSWVGMAEVTVLAAFYSLIPTQQAFAKAKECLAAAASLQGESGEACYVEGLLTWSQRRWDACDAARLRAFELEPDNVQALGFFGMVLCTRQRLDEGMVYFDRAREVDPLSAFAYAATGVGLLTCGRLEECGRFFEDALSMEAENTIALWGSGIAKVAVGQADAGIAALESAAEHSRRAAVILGILGWAHAVAGRIHEAKDIVGELRGRPESSPTVVTEAWLLAALGEMEDAWEVLARAENECQGMLCYLGLPPFELFHGDARWDALLERYELT